MTSLTYKDKSMIKLKLAIALSTISTIAFPLALTILPTTANEQTKRVINFGAGTYRGETAVAIGDSF